MHLPYTHKAQCSHSWHYHFAGADPLDSEWASDPANLMSSDCDTYKVAALAAILTSTDLATTFGGALHTAANWQLLDKVQRLNYYTPRYWQPLVTALTTAFAESIGMTGQSMSFDDLYCKNCESYVSKVLDRAHWDNICGTCSNHKDDDCECCQSCGYFPCECCQICGEAAHWNCECCNYCEQTSDSCECETCSECGYKEQDCGCGNSSYSHFGSTKVAPWTAREDAPYEAPLPKMSDCQHGSIDPIQSAADFYLLDAIKNLIRTSDLQFSNEDQSGRFYAQRADLVRSDSMLSALVTSAERSYRNLVDFLAPNFLAYALPAVGGELRYHSAVGKALKTSSREGAWDKFVDVVQAKGAETLFEADQLFLEFGGGAYGGKKWGDAAKVVGHYLNGSMPAWLFVDRVFTLQHNGGCFLNKVSWQKRNRLGWGLSKILYVLNAHAGKNHSGDEDAPTDWALLLQVASPEVAAMFMMAERHIARIGRRFGAVHTPIPVKSHIRKSMGY